MRSYKYISDVRDESMAQGYSSQFWQMLEIATEEEKAFLKSKGESPRKAKKIAEEKIVEWMQPTAFGTEFADDKGIRYEALAYYRVSYLMAIALRHLLNKAD